MTKLQVFLLDGTMLLNLGGILARFIKTLGTSLLGKFCGFFIVQTKQLLFNMPTLPQMFLHVLLFT
jgi:hypothetical protein